jgi:hypothetical protein
VVVNTNDTGDGSLRQALQDATPGSRVTFDSDLEGELISLQSGQLLVEKSLVIDASSLAEGLTIDGGNTNPVFEIRPKGNVNLSAKILWVTGYLDEATAPDRGFTDLLKGAGHDVTRWFSRNDPTASDVATLNAADLIIISRSVSNRHFEDEDQLWNTKNTTPVLNMSGFTIRSNRLGWMRGKQMIGSIGPVALRRLVEEHPIFDGSVWEDGSGNELLEPHAALLTGERGISFNVERPKNGSLLATVANAESGVQTALGPVEYAAGAIVDGASVLAGHRMIFLAGSREADGASSSTVGRYDLTSHGAQLLLNCVIYLADRAQVTLQGLTISGGTSVARGGGIINKGADLTLSNVTVEGNRATEEGGGIHNVSVLSVTRSIIRNNNAAAPRNVPLWLTMPQLVAEPFTMKGPRSSRMPPCTATSTKTRALGSSMVARTSTPGRMSIPEKLRSSSRAAWWTSSIAPWRETRPEPEATVVPR